MFKPVYLISISFTLKMEKRRYEKWIDDEVQTHLRVFTEEEIKRDFDVMT